MESAVHVIMFNKKNRSLLQGICTCLKYCFDELKRQQLNFRVENTFLFSSSILNSHPQVSEFGWLLSVHSPGCNVQSDLFNRNLLNIFCLLWRSYCIPQHGVFTEWVLHLCFLACWKWSVFMWLMSTWPMACVTEDLDSIFLYNCN